MLVIITIIILILIIISNDDNDNHSSRRAAKITPLTATASSQRSAGPGAHLWPCPLCPFMRWQLEAQWVEIQQSELVFAHHVSLA